MDRDDMRETTLPPYKGGWPTPRVVGKHPALGMAYESTPTGKDGSWVQARFERDPYALFGTIADTQGPAATCPDCVEFGTICRPCRKARYEARNTARRQAESRALRFRIGTSVLCGFLVLALLLGLQARWDKECDAKVPRSRWNGDLWACEVRR